MSRVKKLLLNVLTASGAASVFRILLREHASVLMLHRFSHPDRGVAGHDPRLLRTTLARLRRAHVDLLPLDELITRLRLGVPTRGAVAFTVDDGYADHAEVAAPVFAEFDCPATTFVVSGFLDGNLWLWWDQLEYVLDHTAHSALALAVGGSTVTLRWTDPSERRTAQLELIERLKVVPDPERVQALSRVAGLLEVDLPTTPPQRYAPMTWDQLRRAERGGMRFGPHTVTHPILARTADPQAEREIAESWRRLQDEAAHPQPVFCYPNGGVTDFGPREIRILDGLGFLGAVSGEVGYATSHAIRAGEERFRIRRFPFRDDLPHTWQYLSGVERAKQLLSVRVLP